MNTSPRPWAVGQSATCLHRPRCANLFVAEDGTDVTAPCSGLSVEDATLIATAVNALETGATLDAVLAACEAQWRRVAELASDAARAQGKGGH